MIRWNGFGRSLGFAAIAAAGYAPFALLTSTLWNSAEALVAYAWLTAIVYPLGIGNDVRRGFGAAALTGCSALATAALGAGVGPSLLAAAACLAVARSGVVYARRLPRAIVLETILVLAGLAVAEQLIGRSTASIALSVWGFYLVQSVFFLVGGARRERTTTPVADPFEAARDQALALLDDGR